MAEVGSSGNGIQGKGYKREATGAGAGHDNGGSGVGGYNGKKMNGFPPPPFYKSVGQLNPSADTKK